jgi:PAS domain S-box-containing protein
VWIATGQGRRYVVLAALGTAAALLLPYALVGPGRNDPLAPWRAVVGPLVYAFLAVTINWLSARIRDHVTVLRASEERLRAANRLTQSVLDAVTEQAVIGTDRAGLVDVWNPGAAAMLGLDPAQAQGLPIEGLVLPAELERRRSRVDGATAFAALVDKVAPGRADVAEWTWVRADGSTLPVVVAITARQDETGATVGYIFVATDHTAVREAAREQDHFFGMVSHELRTPLAAVLGHLELLRDDPLTDDQRHHMAVAERNAHRLLRLVNDLLLAAQVDAGGFPLEITDVDLAAVVAASAQSAGPAADLADVRLVVEVSPDVTSVPGDAGRLGQVCDNLVSNAIKFTPAGGTVTVRLRNEKDEVRLSVSDTGIGIPAGEVDQLFGRFFRASSAVATAVPGVGLGLAITRAIVAAHHGTVRVTSVEGGGTTFTVCLPVLLAEDFAAPDAADPARGE